MMMMVMIEGINQGNNKLYYNKNNRNNLNYKKRKLISNSIKS